MRPTRPLGSEHASPHFTQCSNNRGFWSALSDAEHSSLDFHIERRNCRDRRPTAPPAELSGPYLATTIAGVRATLTAQAHTARSNPNSAPPPPFCSSGVLQHASGLHPSPHETVRMLVSGRDPQARRDSVAPSDHGPLQPGNGYLR